MYATQRGWGTIDCIVDNNFNAFRPDDYSFAGKASTHVVQRKVLRVAGKRS